jgi:tetratricopeptide (TPR) repeat protein
MKHAVACAGLFVLTLLAYSNSFDAAFVYDNRTIILDNPRLREPFAAAWPQIARTEYWWPMAGEPLYRPLTIFSYWCNYRLFGNADRPPGYHVVNLLLHAGNALLVYALALMWLKQPGALAAGAVFALHPVATEAVTNIVGRADLLAALGVLGGLLAHRRSQSARGWRRAGWLSLLGVAFGVGLFSKENAIVLPAALLLHDVTFRSRRWSNYLALVPALLLWWLARHDVFAHHPPIPLTAGDYLDNSLLKGDALTARLTAVKIIGKYLGLLIWPAALSADYSYDQIPLAGWRDAGMWAAAVVVLGVLATAVWTWRRWPAVTFFSVFFFVALAPVSNIFILCRSTMAERFLYLPLVGFAGLAGWLAARWWERWPRPVGAVAGVVLLAYGARTYVRNEDWREPLTFWVQLAHTSPRSYRAQSGLAGAVIAHDPDHRHVDAAVASIRRALEIAPDSVSAQITAGAVYRTKGDTLTARDAQGEMAQTPASAFWYQQSLAALRQAASLSAKEQDAARGWRTGQASVPLDMIDSAIYDEMGQTWMRLGNPSAAADAFRHARRANPTRAEVCLRLADALVAAGRPEEAARSYWQASFILPDRAAAQKALAAIYARDCPELSRNCPRIQQDICAAHAEMARLLDEAGLRDAARQAREHAVHDYGCPP